MRCCKNKCDKCKKYKDRYFKQETKNDELFEMIESLIETQNKLIEYIESQKVSGVNIKKKTT